MVSDSRLSTVPPTLPRASLVLRPVSRTCSVAVSEPEVICRRATDRWPERLGVKPTMAVQVPRGVA